jgi:hypothetical protein
MGKNRIRNTGFISENNFGVISLTHRIIVSWSEGSGSGSGGAAKPPGGGADKGGGGASANKFKGVSGSQYKFGVLARYVIDFSQAFFSCNELPYLICQLCRLIFGCLMKSLVVSASWLS